MEREKKVSLAVCIVAGVIIALILVAAYKAEKNHEKKLYLVVHKKIKENALDCYLNNECEGQISLKDLYDKNYLDKVIDPVTKEDMDINLCLEYVNETVEFCE